MAALSEWLQIMLAEIARKREDLERAREEDAQRHNEDKGASEHSVDALRPTSEQRTAQRRI
jgi:hypothetical protein